MEKKQTLAHQLIPKFSLLLLTPQKSPLLFSTTHLQITQEALEVEASLLRVPVAIGADVLKTGSRKHGIMVL